MADVNGDMVLDLIAGTGAGAAPEVVVYNAVDGPPFTDELARFSPFDAGFRGGVNVAGVDIDGNALADNIIVASGPGMESQVKIYSTVLPTDKKSAPAEFGSFTPYPGSSSGVTIATGMVDSHSGRASIVTAPGPGDEPLVKTLRYDLYEPTAASTGASDEHVGHSDGPVTTSQFLAFDQSYRGGVSLSTGWVAGAEGGAKSIVTGMSGEMEQCEFSRADHGWTDRLRCISKAPTITPPMLHFGRSRPSARSRGLGCERCDYQHHNGGGCVDQWQQRNQC